MPQLHKILLVIIVLEALELAVLGYFRVTRPKLPLVNYGMVDSITAEDIKQAESRLDTGNPHDWTELGNLYRLFHYYPQAEYCYAQADSLASASSEHLYLWAICRERMGRLEEANRLYHRAISANSRFLPFCWLHIGMNHLRLEEIESAEQALRNARRIPEAKMLLSRLLIRTGRANQALPLLDELSQQFPDAHDVDLMKSYAASEQGDRQAARRLQEVALRHATTIPTGSGPESVTWIDADGTVQSYLDHYGPKRRLGEARALDRGGKTDEAIQIVEEVLQSRWSQQGVVLLADLYQKTDRPQRAIELLTDAVQRVGAAPHTLKRLGEACAAAGHQKEALDLWETAAQWQPTAELHRKMAEMYAEAGDVKLARRHQGLEKFRSGVDALRLNRLEEAHAALDQAVAMLPDHASAWFYFAETCRFLDRPERAINAYTRCLELHPDHGRALRGLRHLSAPAGE